MHTQRNWPPTDVRTSNICPLTLNFDISARWPHFRKISSSAAQKHKAPSPTASFGGGFSLRFFILASKAYESRYRVARQLAHARLRLLEGVAQFRQVGNDDFSERVFDLG